MFFKKMLCYVIILGGLLSFIPILHGSSPFARLVCKSAGNRFLHTSSLQQPMVQKNSIGCLVAGGALLGFGYYLGKRECSSTYPNQAKTTLNALITGTKETPSYHFEQMGHHLDKAGYHLGKGVEKYFEEK